jgi:uncharacterized protein YecE (DUF72 family)
MDPSTLIRFGASTWAYEVWKGQIYKKKYTKRLFDRECLGEYCQYLYNGEPLFRTVGNDSTFYRPPTANQLKNYLNQIPEDFQMCFEVWEELTIPTFSKQPRYGVKAGQPNPRFLDASLFKDLVLTPVSRGELWPHIGPFLFEFQRHGLLPRYFVGKLDTFFGQLPKDFCYVQELVLRKWDDDGRSGSKPIFSATDEMDCTWWDVVIENYDLFLGGANDMCE